MAVTQGTWGNLFGGASSQLGNLFRRDWGVTEGLFGNNAGFLSNPNRKVLGATDDASNDTQTSQPAAMDYPESQYSGTQNTVSPVRNTGAPTPSSNNIVPSMAPINNEIDNAYNQRISSLDNIANQVRAFEPNIYNDANAIYNSAKSGLDTGKAGALASLDQSGMDANKRKQDATIAATRLYNELLQGGNQRYGGASSAGQAFSEIANVEQQRRGAATEADYGQTVRQITALRNDTENKYTTALSQAEAQKTTAITSAKQALQNKLIEIEQMKDSAAADKSAQRLSALQEYRNNIFDINSQVATFQQNLQLQKQQSDQVLEQTMKAYSGNTASANGAVGDFYGNTNLNPTSGLAQGGNTASAGGNMYTGAITKKRDDQLVGSTYDPRKDFFASA